MGTHLAVLILVLMDNQNTDLLAKLTNSDEVS